MTSTFTASADQAKRAKALTPVFKAPAAPRGNEELVSQEDRGGSELARPSLPRSSAFPEGGVLS